MTRHHSLAALGRDWTTLGSQDPLWAVYVDPAKRGGRWDIDDLLATGRAEIGQAIDDLDRLGACQGRGEALDFGCGVGRLTAALADHFGTATGVDISLPMLETATRLHGSNDRCRFVHNDRPDLSIFPDASFDLVYSSIVLQHLTPDLSDGYIREFVRVTRPQGAIVLVVPQRHLRTPRGMIYAYAPHAAIGWIQRVLFGFPAPMRMHTVPLSRVRGLVEPLGAQVADARPLPWPGHWEMSAIYVSTAATAA